jgi:hypothetical protein
MDVLGLLRGGFEVLRVALQAVELCVVADSKKHSSKIRAQYAVASSFRGLWSSTIILTSNVRRNGMHCSGSELVFEWAGIRSYIR